MSEIDVLIPKNPPSTDESVANAVATELSLERGAGKRSQISVETWRDLSGGFKGQVPRIGIGHPEDRDKIWVRVVYKES